MYVEKCNYCGKYYNPETKSDHEKKCKEKQKNKEKKMSMKHIQDQVERITLDIARDVYKKHDKIMSQAYEGLTGDMVDEYEDRVEDILREMVNERLED